MFLCHEPLSVLWIRIRSNNSWSDLTLSFYRKLSSCSKKNRKRYGMKILLFLKVCISYPKGLGKFGIRIRIEILLIVKRISSTHWFLNQVHLFLAHIFYCNQSKLNHENLLYFTNTRTIIGKQSLLLKRILSEKWIFQ